METMFRENIDHGQMIDSEKKLMKRTRRFIKGKEDY